MNELTLCAALGGNPEPQAALARQPITGRLIRLADSRLETSRLVKNDNFLDHHCCDLL